MTLSDILIKVNSVMDLDASLPTGTELETRTSYADRATQDISSVAQLPEFKKEYLTTTSTLATIPLPMDFREPMGNPRIYIGSGWEEWELIEAEHKYERGSNSRYCYVLGNPRDGFNLIFNQIVSSDQMSFIYQRYPSGFSTLTDVCEFTDPMLIPLKIESYILYSRSDERLALSEQRFQQQLSNYIGRSSKGSVAGARKTPMTFKSPLSYRS